MALNGKLVSVKEVVNNVLRDNQYKTQDFEVGSMIEWSAEACDLIGVPYNLINDYAIIAIEDHKGFIPCNLHTQLQAMVLTTSGVVLPMRESTSTTSPYSVNNVNDYPLVNPVDPVGFDVNGNPVMTFNNYDSAISAGLINNLPYSLRDITYSTRGNYIFTSFKDGASVVMFYKAFPVDEEGYPLIPDDTSYKIAVQSYIRMKLDFLLWRKNIIARDVFEYAEREWMWYVGQAKTKALTPTYDMMESWKNNWLTLMPKINEQARNFEGVGQSQYINFGMKNYRF
jgi:hypothetical protein